jgi:hypothetical protein
MKRKVQKKVSFPKKLVRHFHKPSRAQQGEKNVPVFPRFSAVRKKMSNVKGHMVKRFGPKGRPVRTPWNRAGQWARRHSLHVAFLLAAVTVAFSISLADSPQQLSASLVADVYDYCVADEDLITVEYEHYMGSPNQCDCHGNCWDENGFWYADPYYTGDDATWGYPGSVDGLGNRWNNYGYWEEDVFYPYDVDVDGFDYDFPGFPDVTEGHPYYYYVMFVGQAGIFDGYPDGTFQPYNSINRVETAKVILGAFGYTIFEDPGTDLGFWDLIPNEWYMPYIYTANMLNIMTGDASGSMRPGDTVNRAEMLRIFLEAANVPLESCVYGMSTDVSYSDWHCKYFQFALVNNLVTLDTSSSALGYLYPAEEMTRGEVAELFYNYNYSYLGAQ